MRASSVRPSSGRTLTRRGGKTQWQVNAAKGLSAVQLSRDLDVQHKTAFVLMHKLREAMAAETGEARLSGTVEVDGAAFGGHVRPANLHEDRVDRRRLDNRSGKRRVVVVLRQRQGRTITRTFLREAQGVWFAQERMDPFEQRDGPKSNQVAMRKTFIGGMVRDLLEEHLKSLEEFPLRQAGGTLTPRP